MGITNWQVTTDPILDGGHGKNLGLFSGTLALTKRRLLTMCMKEGLQKLKTKITLMITPMTNPVEHLKENGQTEQSLNALERINRKSFGNLDRNLYSFIFILHWNLN